MTFEGQNLFITGAADGIGKATATVFAQRGISGIAIADLDENRGPETVAELNEKYNCNAKFYKLNVGDPTAIEDAFKQFDADFGKLDILVNCAGILRYQTMEETTADRWDPTLSINLRGTYLCSREAAIRMKETKSGNIVSIVSASAFVGGIQAGIDYSASKAGIMGVIRTMCKQLAPYGVRVNGVAPGIIATKLTNQGEGYDLNTIPLGRLGTGDDVGRVISFLCSEDAAYVTGQIIQINGGQIMT